jgi:flavodoxin
MILRKKTTRKNYMIALAITVIVVSLSAFSVMAVKDQTYVGSPQFNAPVDAPHEYVVVYYSRSGHSEAVAREVAKRLNAPIARITANYPLSFKGQRKAIADAEAQAFPEIEVEAFDFQAAKRVYLVAPAWMFRPAPALWTFVRDYDFSGKEVVLIMTGNSRFKLEEIDKFSTLIESRGGHLLYQEFINRGRIFWQMSRAELLESVESRMDTLIPMH